MELFSERWAAAWCQALNASPACAAAAAGWRGTVALVVRGDSREARAAYLDAEDGTCRARVAEAEDLAAADYVFEAPAPVWTDLFAGRLAPAVAVLGGKLRLTRGSFAALMPHAAAARELIAAAVAVSRAVETADDAGPDRSAHPHQLDVEHERG